MTVRHGLTLVECPPYGGKLQESSCAERWRAMAGTKAHAPPGTKAHERAAKMRALVHCAGCKLGEARSTALAASEGGQDE